ncbi:DUF4433 domain-containing protein [Tomitella gaofuii]|uniref:type II toxin-antitoxin system toxin DNA ADP-ribosyl transferase DarT n=1 Tax=Tomitella gaofuii TaxID=2760083 RepID=UPI0015F8ABE5|nr:DUF4433 domain-containing protein [Tomitella gaofuii]
MLGPDDAAIFHVTHIDNLRSIIREGLYADRGIAERGGEPRSVGNREIRDARRRREVTVPPGGAVGDYVPFYFAPRSPMLFTLTRGGGPKHGFDGDCSDLVYLCTRLSVIRGLSLASVFTDRNAAKVTAEQTDDASRLGTLIDWELMNAALWFDTPDEPDRMERRMAECLVHRHVPWSAVTYVGVHDARRMSVVRGMLSTGHPKVGVQEDWYY